MKCSSVESKTIEWLRFFCISAVVLLHAHGLLISYQNGINDTIRILFSEGLCRVAVPIFFLISGYLFFIRLEEWNTNVWKEKLRRRVRTLLYPYLFWNLISILYWLGRPYLAFVLLGIGEPFDVSAWYDSIGGLRAFWDSGTGEYPHNYPLWFIRDLMVFVILSPAIWCYIRTTGVTGLVLLYSAYFIQLWKVPGLSLEGLFFFTLGAFLAIRRIGFIDFFKQHWVVATFIAAPLVLVMVLTYGNYNTTYEYSKCLFTLFGSSCTIGIVSLLIQKQRIKVHSLLSESTFFVFAMHGTIVLPQIYETLSKVLSGSQVGLLVIYFSAPLLTIVLSVIIFYFLSNWMPKTMSILTGGRAR